MNVPLVILFGPPSSGKVMTLLRLTRYLESEGYQVSPIPSYAQGSPYYQQICANFHNYVYSDVINGDIWIRDLLISVFGRKGQLVCHILKIPGQLCFDPSYIQQMPLPRPITNLFSMSNQRIWIFMQALDAWDDITIRNLYVGRIHQLSSRFNCEDKVIFSCSKIDKQTLLLSHDLPDCNAILQKFKNQYNGIFANYEIHNPILRLFKKYNFSFVPFSSGTFAICQSNTKDQFFSPSRDLYPQQLWKAILKAIN